jgi:hypothetical protein
MPKNFTPVEAIEAACICSAPSFVNTSRCKGVQLKGLKFEAQVTSKLDRLDDWEGIPGIWFEFKDQTGHRYAQADWVGFNFRKGVCVIVEVKLSRVAKAWWQLNKLYYPLVSHLFHSWPIAMVEVVANMKPVDIPKPVVAITSLNEAVPNQTSLMRIPYVG